MANTTSAKKAERAAQRRRVFNLRRKSAMKDTVKQLGKALASKDAKAAASLLPRLYKAVDKAAKNHTIHANTAARMKSRISKRLAAISK